MQLKKLFDAQKVLANRIMEEHPELKGQDNLPWKILALQVELGELANEWRGFKMWSHDREPRRIKKTIAFANPGGAFEHIAYPLLEEYVDCLHFLLDIGLEMGYAQQIHYVSKLYNENVKTENIIGVFISIVTKVGTFIKYREKHEVLHVYIDILRSFIGLGEMLGFTWEEIEAAYFDKNKINHDRQDRGY